MRILILLLFVLLSLGCVSSPDREDTPLPVLEPEGYYLRAFISYEKTRRLSEELEKENSETVREFLQSEIERYRKEFTRYLMQAKKLLPNDARVHMLEGAFLLDNKKFKEAIECFKAVLSRHQRSASVYFNLALAYDALGDYQTAYEYCKTALEIDPSFQKAAYLIIELEGKRQSDEEKKTP